MDRKLGLLRPAAWTTGALAAGGFLLYAVGGVLDHADLLVLVMGSIPVTTFALLD